MIREDVSSPRLRRIRKKLVLKHDVYSASRSIGHERPILERQMRGIRARIDRIDRELRRRRTIKHNRTR